jgi:hypothetical protein
MKSSKFKRSEYYNTTGSINLDNKSKTLKQYQN